MPFIVDKAPPVDGATLQAARSELPREYGTRFVEHRGRRVLMVRVPRAQPDYNYELAAVAFYVGIHEMKDVKDVLLVGDEKTVRMEPLRLRDHVREQLREDQDTAPRLRAGMSRDYGWTTNASAHNQNHRALIIRLPVPTVADADEGVLLRARAALGSELVTTLRAVHFVYLLADQDFARIGRRIFIDAVCSDLAAAVALPESRTANPLHLSFQTPGAFIPREFPRR